MYEKFWLLKILLKITKKWGIYTLISNLPVGSWKRPICPSGWLAGRPANGHIFYCWAQRSTGTGSREQRLSGRSIARSTELIQRAELSAGRPSRSTGSVDRGHFQREEALWRSTVPVDRPSAWLRAHSVHVGRPARLTAHCYGRPAWSTGSQPVWHFWDRKTWVFNLNKIP